MGAGLLHFALRRSQNVHWQALDVNKRARAALKHQKPCVLWFTGLSGAGKSTIANLVEKQLHADGRHTYLLDGDNVRHGLNRDLGLHRCRSGREHPPRGGGRAADGRCGPHRAGVVHLAVSAPSGAWRAAWSRPGEFVEVFVDTPLAEAERRDAKGLYRKARRGELKNFTGIDSPYESPENPEIRLDTTQLSPEAAAQAVIAYLRSNGIIDSR